MPTEYGCEQIDDLGHKLVFLDQVANEWWTSTSGEADLQGVQIANDAIFVETLPRHPNATMRNFLTVYQRSPAREVDTMRVTLSKLLLLDSELRYAVPMSAAYRST